MSAFGDSAGLARAARILGEAADALDQQRRSLAGVVAELLSGGDAWAGQASVAFAASFAEQLRRVDDLAGGARTAAEVLARLGAELAAAGDAAEAARRRALAAGIVVDDTYRRVPVLRAATPLDCGSAAAQAEVDLAIEAARARAEQAWRSACAALAAIGRSWVDGAFAAVDALGTVLDVLAGGDSRAARALATTLGDVSADAARVPGLRQAPVLGLALAGAGVAADVHGGVAPGRAAAANGTALVAGEVAGGLVLTGLAAAGAPAVATVAAVALVGYGVGTLAHTLIAYGDLRDFRDDADTARDMAEWVEEHSGGRAAHAPAGGRLRPAAVGLAG